MNHETHVVWIVIHLHHGAIFRIIFKCEGQFGVDLLLAYFFYPCFLDVCVCVCVLMYNLQPNKIK